MFPLLITELLEELSHYTTEKAAKGQANYHELDQRRPLIVIDGKEISWRQFGQMLMTYEGFNFKLEIFDKSDEIP